MGFPAGISIDVVNRARANLGLLSAMEGVRLQFDPKAIPPGLQRNVSFYLGCNRTTRADGGGQKDGDDQRYVARTAVLMALQGYGLLAKLPAAVAERLLSPGEWETRKVNFMDHTGTEQSVRVKIVRPTTKAKT